MRILAIIGISYLLIASTANATELVHKFGSPSFSGINQSAHYLTIDEQERTRKAELAQKAQDALDEAQREADLRPGRGGRHRAVQPPRVGRAPARLRDGVGRPGRAREQPLGGAQGLAEGRQVPLPAGAEEDAVVCLLRK